MSFLNKRMIINRNENNKRIIKYIIFSLVFLLIILIVIYSIFKLINILKFSKCQKQIIQYY